MSYPEEPDLSYICKTYMVVCDEYPGVYEFLKFLDKLQYAECSEYPQDWFTIKNGIIQSHWIVFVSCLPKDMDRLSYIRKYLGYDISIIDSTKEESDDYLPF